MKSGWQEKRLGSVATLQRGFDLAYRLRRSGTVPIVTSSGIEDTHCEARVRAPGVVTGRYGTIGKVFYVNEDFWPLNTTLYVRDFHGNDPLFLSYLLRTIDFHTHSGKSGVPGVNRNDLHEIDVALPVAKTEQEAIAQALSDADDLVASLEHLIVKKRQIKQGTMQELLTGTRRLLGFAASKGYTHTDLGIIPKDWKLLRIGDVCRVYGRIGFRGYTIGDIVTEGRGAITISPSNLQHNKTDFTRCTYISWDKYRESPEIQIENGDILLVKTGSTVGKTAIVERLPEKATVNPQIVVLKNVCIAKPFLGYTMQSKAIQRQLSAAVVGGALPTLSQKQIEGFQFPIPAVSAEQEFIAAVLADMDEEIAALETWLAKTCQVKTGMMQELLTGRIRLV